MVRRLGSRARAESTLRNRQRERRYMSPISGNVVRAALLAAVAVQLSGCFESDSDKQRAAARQAEATLMEDKSNAVPELTKRLHEKVRVMNGIVFIDDDVLGSTALSGPVRWKLDCGVLGVTISLLYKSGSTDDDGAISATLARASVSAERCKDYLQELALDAQRFLPSSSSGRF